MQAINTLQEQGITIQNMPTEIVELQSSEQRLQNISQQLEEEMKGLDTRSIDLAVEMLDAEDEALVNYGNQMEDVGNLAAEQLKRITSLIDQYSEEEKNYRHKLTATEGLSKINVQTKDGLRTLEKTTAVTGIGIGSKIIQHRKTFGGWIHYLLHMNESVKTAEQI